MPEALEQCGVPGSGRHLDPTLLPTMADDEILFDDVYELCEVIGK